MALDPSAVAIQAAVDGNLRLLKKMASKIDLREAKDPNGVNLLHLAATKGRLEICRFLVEESELDVNSTTPNGLTPVAQAAAAGMVSVLRYLLDHGGDPGMPDAMGYTPLHDAADYGHYEAVRLLVSSGVDVDPFNSRRLTPLSLAAMKGHDQAVKVLLEHGADPNRVVSDMLSPLMMASHAESLNCIKLLVEAGADLNFKSPFGASPLLKAVVDGSTDIVNFLLQSGADPNIPDVFGQIPIMHAARDGRRDLVKVIFPYTKPIASLPNWTVDGIIDTIKHMPFNATAAEKEQIVADAKQQGNEAFAKGDYLRASYFYDTAMTIDPVDAILFSNRSLCWLRLGEGELALLDAQKCKLMRPRWPKAWYREGAALSLLKNYKGAASTLMEALKLDPANDEIKTALREAIEGLRCAARSGKQNH